MGTMFVFTSLEVQMFLTANAATQGRPLSSVPFARLKWIAFAVFLSGALGYLVPQSHAAGLDCPEIGSKAVPNLLNDLQIKLVASGNSIDLANEISDVVNKLQIAEPNISYAELTNVAIAAYCRVVANMTNLTVSEKWDRMRQFDTILQRQLAANSEPPGTLIIASIPLPPAVYRELRSQAATVNQSPAQFMAAVLVRAAGN